MNVLKIALYYVLYMHQIVGHFKIFENRQSCKDTPNLTDANLANEIFIAFNGSVLTYLTELHNFEVQHLHATM